MNRKTAVPAGILFFISFVAALPAAAGWHAAVSEPTDLDVAPPAIEILTPQGGEVLHGFDEILFEWTVSESHYTPHQYDRYALVRTRGSAKVATGFPPVDGLHDWLWTVFNISSGYCTLEVTARDTFGNETTAISEPFVVLIEGTGSSDDAPTVSRLSGAEPNPFNPSTTLEYALSAPGRATLTVHDVRGRLVRTLVDGPVPAGVRSVEWDGRDDAGRPLAGGAYVARLLHDGRPVMSRKVVMLP